MKSKNKKNVKSEEVLSEYDFSKGIKARKVLKEIKITKKEEY